MAPSARQSEPLGERLGCSPLIPHSPFPIHHSRPLAAAKGRAVILPVVLFVLALIGLLAAMFSFRVNADLAATQAMAFRLQTRLAAEAGVERVKLLLRTARFDSKAWYNNPDMFNRIIVSAHGRDARVAGTSEEFDEPMVYRFSIVADDPDNDKDMVRFGITDEASKLNLNTATEAQLLKLVAGSLVDNSEIDPQKIVDAIIDWRDPDSDPHGEDPTTEGEYYRLLEKPYRVKNGPFDTIEELLLVKGMTPEILYGEDFDRNGLLSENEKDRDLTFPPDNGDDVLNRGLYPYLTVLSAENNVANDNRPRAYLLGDEAVLRTELAAAFPDEPAIVDYIISAVKPPQGPGVPSGPGQPPHGPGSLPQPPGDTQGPPTDGTGVKNPPTSGSSDKPPVKPGPKKQRGDPTPSPSPPPKGPQPDPRTGAPSLDLGQPNPEKGDGTQPPDSGGQGGQKDSGSGAGTGTGGQQGTGSGGGGSGATSIHSPASLMLPKMVDGQPVPNPLTPEHLAVLMDRTTTISPQQRTIPGLINVNTAPRQVLECVDGLSSDQIDAILAKRNALSAVTASTTAWLVSEGIILDAAAFEKIAPQITARGQQFTIESVGYADHIGMVTRLQVIVDMNGPIAQTIYYRDISGLGGAYPIRKQDKEKVRGR